MMWIRDTRYAIRYMFSRHRRERGFTVFELVVAMSIVIIVLVGIARFQSSTLNFNRIFGEQIKIRNEARKAVEEILDEIRMVTVSEEGAYPILLAQDNAVTFYADYDSDGVVERIRYFVAGSVLRKGTLEPSGMPFIYDDINEVVSDVVDSVILNDPIFDYFDGNFEGDEGGPPSPGPDSIDLRLRTDTSSGNEEESLDDVEILCDTVPTFSESFGSSDTTVVAGWVENESSSDDAQIRTSVPLGGSPTSGYLSLEEGADVTRNINTSGCTTIDIRYYWRGDNSAESGEYIYIEWKDAVDIIWNIAAQHDADPPGCTWGSCVWSSQENWNLFGGVAMSPTESIRHVQVRLELDSDVNRAPQPVVIESAVTLRNLKDNF